MSTFQRTTATLVDGASEYLWSTSGNWVGGIPANGGVATINVTTASNPGSYDDIANLELYQLNLTDGALAVAGNLTVDDLILPSNTNSYAIEADTFLGASSAKLTIDAITGSGAFIEADGANASTFVKAATDTGNEYDVAGGAFLELTAKPSSASTFDFPTYTGDHGTIALTNPGATIAARLGGVAIGDVLELPGTTVTAVTYGANSLTVTTNQGTVTFNNVRYDTGEVMHGFTAAVDSATGLEAITFEGSTVSTFQRTTATSVDGASEYLWSTSGNWVGGIPANGGVATINVTTASNPGAYDDIANLELYQLNLTQGALAVAGNLTVDDLILPSNNNSYAIEADTFLGASSAKLTIDAITGNGAFIEADGANASTFVNAATDTGNEYDVAGGAFLELKATPISASTFDFPTYTGDYGTIALANPGSTIAARLGGIAIGDVLELPGTSVTAVTYGATSLTVTTNQGAVTFNNVRYDTGEVMHGFTAAIDPATGLEEITFQGSDVSTFQRTTATTVDGASEYLWSTAGNWVGGIPANGGVATINVTTASNPGAYDDIANLELYQLNLTDGALAVAGNLTVDDLVLPSNTNSYAIEADTFLGASSAKLTIDAITGNGAFIEADGANASTFVNAATDTGNEYDVAGGAFLELRATPSSASTFDFPTYTGDHGTIALANPGATIAARLGGVAIGDVLELPGTTVTAVTYGANSLTVTTNQGAVTFTNVRYDTGEVMHGFTAAIDPATGLEAITFQGSAVSTFQQGAATSVDGASEYVWSNSSNWVGGVPVNGGVATFNISSTSNPGGYDNIANLELYQLNLTDGALAVAGNLTVDDLILPSNNNSYAIEADTFLGAPSAKLTIDAITGTGAFIEADGANASTFVNAATDTGNEYDVAGGAFLELTAKPSSASTFDFPTYTLDHGTIALANPGATIAARLGGIAVGDVLELPGTTVTAVTYGTNSLSVTTNLGTVTFTNVRYDAGEVFRGFSVAPDSKTGLEAITIACFARGTNITTASGETPVESLRIGDQVVTASGDCRPILWIGRRAIDIRNHPQPENVWPVRIDAHALGENQPLRPLWLSPGHCIALEGVLIPACALLNDRSVTQIRCETIEYWHVELDAHDVIVAEGLPAESYLDTGNRAAFVNGGAFIEAHPDFEPRHWAETCLPHALEGPVVARVKTRLLARLAQQGLTVTDDGDAHIWIDGQRIEPIRLSDTRLAFALPPGGGEITLRSRTFIPAHTLAYSGDSRALGLSIGDMQIDGTAVALQNDDGCALGWHSPEFDGERFTHRWTTGLTPLPPKSRIVIIDLRGEGYYWQASELLPTVVERNEFKRVSVLN